ncbi:MAG: hypothetical protein KY476_06655 [Planctomycetes bacterium]|nr:hypothetical protein [Planctomycetota bacterium]
MSALSVNTNLSALSAQLNLQRSNSLLQSSLERLSTGFRINRASDDPSGLVLSEFQRAQISGLDQSVRNVDRAISLSQTAEGGLNEISSLLTDLRALAVDSANNGALDPASLEANQASVRSILSTIDRIAGTTRFGTQDLLDGDSGISGFSNDPAVTFLRATDPSVVSPTNAPFAVTVTTAATRATVTAGVDQANPLAQAETLVINGVDIELEAGLNQAQVIDRINEFSGQTGVVAFQVGTGATQLRTELFGSEASINVISNRAPTAASSGFNNAAVAANTGVDAVGTINGVTVTGQGNVLTGDAGTAASGISIRLEAANANATTTLAPGANAAIVLVDNSRTFQIGAFADPVNRATLTLDPANTSALGIGVTDNRFANLNQIDVRSADGANDAIAVIDQAIAEVSSQRGEVGAFQRNTLESTQSNLRTQLVNLQTAESSLRDTDFAEEISRFFGEQVRQQVATTVLGLANQSSLSVLTLLQNQNA